MIIATHNQGKLKEFQAMFKELALDIPLETLTDYPEIKEIEETGTTFEENARLKAETVASLTGEIVLADDSGLVVPALNGEPGVYSARYSGEGANAEKNNQKLLKELATRAPYDRAAYFVSVIAVSAPNQPTLVVEGRAHGQILEDLTGDQGFGYDPLFFVPEEGKTFAQMTADEKNSVSHRGAAIEELKESLPMWLERGGF